MLTCDGAYLAGCELPERLFCAFNPRIDVKPIARELIAHVGAVSAVAGAAPERRMEVQME